MNINKLKPIPKYIEKKILALDKQLDPNRRGLRFYAYITTIDKDIAKVTIALRNKGKVVHMKQVCVHALNDERAYVKDIEYNFLGISAYRVGWYDEGFKYRYNMRPYYNDGIWYNVPFKYYNPYAPIVNKKYVLKHERFKYSQADKYPCQHFIKYLRLYLQYPQIEYLVKAGLTKFIDSITILKKIDKDKHFAKWLLKNKTQLISNEYYVDSVIRAYNHGTNVEYENNLRVFKQKLKREDFREFAQKHENKLDKLAKYVVKQHTSFYSYKDYYHACIKLGVDMSLDKNLFPHDFRRWHDIRLDQYATKCAEENAKKKAELMQQFATVAQKYASLGYTRKGDYIVIIAMSPQDLIREGEVLHHCVGRMNYDQKFAREQSLIFFLRDKSAPETPLVTMEYSPSQKRLLQCYGDHDSRPNEQIMQFVNDKWLPYANRKLNHLAA